MYMLVNRFLLVFCFSLQVSEQLKSESCQVKSACPIKITVLVLIAIRGKLRSHFTGFPVVTMNMASRFVSIIVVLVVIIISPLGARLAARNKG